MKVVEKKRLNTPEGAFFVFSIYHRKIIDCRFDIKDKTILNIGAGNLIGLDLLFLLVGARRVISIDLHPGNYRYPEISNQLPFFKMLWEVVQKSGLTTSQIAWPGIIFRNNGKVLYNTDRLIRLSPSDASHLPLKNSCIDFALSNAVFEHIKEPDKAIEEIARTLIPGGHTMHRVDLRDHSDFSNPLGFLRPEQPTGGCNLWRSYQYKEAFERHGLEIIEFDIFDRCNVTDKDRKRFKDCFKRMPCTELGKLRFMVCARKR